MSLDFQFLSVNQIYGKGKLKIFEKIKAEAKNTDFAALISGWDITSYWTNTHLKNGKICIVGSEGKLYNCFKEEGVVGGRPALKFSSISSLFSNPERDEEGILKVEYGEYPQEAVHSNLQYKLEKLYKSHLLNKTNKTYTTYPMCSNYSYPEKLEEFEFENKKYVRLKANFRFDPEILSNGETYYNGDNVWVEVKPIKWLVDEESDLAISQDILFTGIKYNNNNYDLSFDSTNIKKFMNDCFSKEIQPSSCSKIKNVENDYSEKTRNRENYKKLLINYKKFLHTFKNVENIKYSPYIILGIPEKEYSEEELLQAMSCRIKEIQESYLDKKTELINGVLDAYNEIINSKKKIK